MTAAEMEREREKRDRERVMRRKTEKGKQFFCVSHQFAVVQFLLSSTGNNYQEGMTARSTCSLFTFTRIQMFEDIFISSDEMVSNAR